MKTAINVICGIAGLWLICAQVQDAREEKRLNAIRDETLRYRLQTIQAARINLQLDAIDRRETNGRGH